MVSIDELGGVSAARGWRARIRLLFAHPAHPIALGLGSGLLGPGPGTWGTALAWALFACAQRWLPWSTPIGFAVLAAMLVIGTWAADRAGRALGEVDAGAIVIDEIAAFWLVLLMLPAAEHPLRWQLAAFVLFRVFDIVKPPPIRQIDRRWRNALGVMFDDLVAAFYTLLVLALWVRYAG